MATSRLGLFQEPRNRCDSIVGSIDRHLALIHQSFSKAFAGGVEAPAGDELLKQQVFEYIWNYLAQGDSINFSSPHELLQFFESCHHNLENHIQDACDNLGCSRRVISPNKVSMLKSIIEIYHILQHYRLGLMRFRKNSPESFLATINELLQTCDKIESEFSYIDEKKVEKLIFLLNQFALLLTDELGGKQYINKLIPDEGFAQTEEAVEFSYLRSLISSLPSVKELNADIDQYNEIKDPRKSQIFARSQIEKHIGLLANVIKQIEVAVQKLHSCSQMLENIVVVEDDASPYLEKLKNYEACISAYQLALELAGMDKYSLEMHREFFELDAIIHNAIAECGKQSTAEIVTAGFYSCGWNSTAALLADMNDDITKRLRDMTRPYLSFQEELKKVSSRVKEVQELNYHLDFIRTRLAARVSVAQAVLDKAVTKLDMVSDELEKHIENTASYTRKFVIRHGRNILACASAGTGVSTAVSYMAMANPPVATMAVAGAILGSAAAASMGLMNDQASETRQKNGTIAARKSRVI